MASSKDQTKVSKASSGIKKDKSTKKRKEDATSETSTQSLVTIQDEAAPTKKEKSSKKRKADVLAESTQSALVTGKDENSSAQDLQRPSGSLSPVTDSNKPVEDDLEEKPPSKKRKSSVEEIEVDITAPEPPSKKALRRLKKGKPLPPSKSGAESTPEPEAKQAKKAEVEKRSEHGVWIGNLPFHVSKADLRTFITSNSEITEDMVTRIHMPGPNDHKSANKVEEKKKYVKVVNNKGFAYVDFSSAEAVKQAVDLSEQLVSGRRVLIKDNKSFEGRPEKTKAESRNDGKPASTRVFLGNLSFDTTEDSLKEHFEKCGSIASVKVATFEDTGKCKGYAWIVFEELESAEHAVRGYVRIEEAASDASESEEEADTSDGGSDAEHVRAPKAKKTKLRKWWVNRIKGRPLRMEFAEDAQVRYKKRYGKDGTKQSAVAGEPSEDKPRERPRERPAVTKVEYRQPYAPRLTGGIVESKGSKITF